MAAGLGALLIVLVGATIFILLSRPSQGPSASASPTTVALASPSASPTFSFLPTLSPIPTVVVTASPEVTSPPLTPTPEITLPPTATPEVTPTPEITLPPTATPEITPTPTPTITAAPTAPPVPTSPDRELRLTDVGLDPRKVDPINQYVERYLTFNVDGPSLIQVELSNATAKARVCLFTGAEQPNCQDFKNGTLVQPVYSTGSTTWTVKLIAVSQTSGMSTDVTLDFNANSPQVVFDRFRMQGTPNPAYNGFSAAIDASPGTLSVGGKFDGIAAHQWHVTINEAGVGPTIDQDGSSNIFGPFNQDVSAETSYVVNVFNPNTDGETASLFMRATLVWP